MHRDPNDLGSIFRIFPKKRGLSKNEKKKKNSKIKPFKIGSLICAMQHNPVFCVEFIAEYVF